MFFLSLILFTFICSLNCISPAEGFDRTPLFASNLQFGLTTGTDDIIVEHEKHLDQMIRLGSVDIGDGYRLYHAKLYFTVDANLYTSYNYRDVFSFSEMNQQATWLNLYAGPIEPEYQHYIYNIEYNAYRLSSFLAYGIDGVIGVSASYTDLSPELLQVGSTEYMTMTSELYTRIAEKSIIGASWTEIGQYDTYYQGDNAVELNAIDLNKDAEPDGSNGVAEHINNLALGAKRGDQTTPTFQQGEIMVQRGVISDNRFRCTIRPDVKVTHETVEVRSQTLYVDTSTGFLGTSPAGIREDLTGPVNEKTYDRIIGWQIKNYNIHLQFSIEVDIYSKTAFVYRTDSDRTLNDVPVYMLEDVYFNNLFYGDTDVTLTLDSSDPVSTWLNSFWDNYKWYIILAAVVALVIFAGPTLLPMMQAKLMQNVKRT